MHATFESEVEERASVGDERSGPFSVRSAKKNQDWRQCAEQVTARGSAQLPGALGIRVVGRHPELVEETGMGTRPGGVCTPGGVIWLLAADAGGIFRQGV